MGSSADDIRERLYAARSRSEVDARLALLHECTGNDNVARYLCDSSFKATFKPSALRKRFSMGDKDLFGLVSRLVDKGWLTPCETTQVSPRASMRLHATYRWHLHGLDARTRGRALESIRSLDPRIWQANS